MSEIAIIDSDKDTHFTGALIQHAMELEDINFPDNWRTAGIQSCMITGISIQSDQNLEWDVFIFSKATADDTDIDIDSFVDYFNFASTSGKQIAASGQFYYPLPANIIAIPYEDIDNTGKFHIGLVDRSATAKNAGATGEVKVRILAAPMWGV